jgi:aminoglycoside/choline kinase family phosphotransferase
MQPDQRLQQLNVWLQENFSSDNFTIIPLTNDASFRRYFRVIHNQQNFVAMDAPPDKENSYPFFQLAKWLDSVHCMVPQIYFHDLDQGFLLLNDLGDRLLLSELTSENVNQYYQKAIHIILNLQQQPLHDLAIPAFDSAFIQRELNLFRDWFLTQYLDHPCENDATLQEAFQLMEQAAIALPQTFVHRDFHSRNLMIQPNNDLAVIDFQDAVVGPCTYDLVSLLKDCYISWPLPLVENWVKDFHQQALALKLFDVQWDDFLKGFHAVGLQRHIRILGTFSRLYIRDGKTRYLYDMPLIWNYCLTASGLYPEFKPFHHWLKEKIEPVFLKRHKELT